MEGGGMIDGRNIFWDLDGVLRNICFRFSKHPPDQWDRTNEDGLTVIEYINMNLKDLVNAPTLEYYDLAMQCKPLHVVSIQPELWRHFTSEWLDDWMPDAKIKYVLEPAHKLEYLKVGTRVLIEDSPNLGDYTHTILVDRPYNKGVQVPRRVYNAEQLRKAIGRFLDGD
jgi:hypothetical protein